MSAMASTMLQAQILSQETTEMGFGKHRRPSLDTWVSLPVRAASSDLFSEGPCTPEKVPCKSTLTCGDEEQEFSPKVGCETPKSTQHRIPEVDVDFCPPAPKKPRGMRRLVFACSIECENATARQNLGLSPGYLF